MSFEISNKRPVLELIYGELEKLGARQKHAAIIDPTWKAHGPLARHYRQVKGANYKRFVENRESDASAQLRLNCYRYGTNPWAAMIVCHFQNITSPLMQRVNSRKQIGWLGHLPAWLIFYLKASSNNDRPVALVRRYLGVFQADFGTGAQYGFCPYCCTVHIAYRVLVSWNMSRRGRRAEGTGLYYLGRLSGQSRPVLTVGS